MLIPSCAFSIFPDVLKVEAKILRTERNSDKNQIELFFTKNDGRRFSVGDELIKLKKAKHNPNVFGKWSLFGADYIKWNFITVKK